MPKKPLNYVIWMALAVGLLVLLGVLIANIVREVMPPAVKALTPLEEGSRLFATQCATCHGENREGRVGPALNAESLSRYSHPELENIILFGRLEKGMPPFDDKMSHDRADKLIEFLLQPKTD